MKKHVPVTLGAALASMLWVSSASAQTVVTTRARSRETVVSAGPNSALLSSGLFAFGVPYVASVVVASTSSESADKNLYIPVVGPWTDLANRSGCGGFGQRSCDTETANKVLLVADGIFQGIGALEIVGAFLMPETRTVYVAGEPRVLVGPSRVGYSGYGLAAAGTF
jgi:hypothetical protein